MSRANEEKKNTLVKLTGRQCYELFRNEENNYAVIRFELNDKTEKEIIVTGMIPPLENDVLYDIYGEYVEHPKYGMQFRFHTMERLLPSEKEGVIRYLCSHQFPGIGRVTAEKIVNRVGDDCLNVLRNDPERIDELEFLSEDKKASLEEGLFSSNDGLEELICFLNVHGIGPRNLVRLNKAYGLSALEKLKENPYRVIDEVDGFGFKTADKIGRALGFDEDDERRMYAYLMSLIMDMCMANGDSYINIDEIKERFIKDTKKDEDAFTRYLDQGKVKQKIMQEEDRLYPYSQFESEENIAGFLNRFPDDDLECVNSDEIDIEIDAFEKSIHITYDEEQIEAIHSIFESPFTILTGGPGSGKTTVVKALIEIFSNCYPNASIACIAPTGRAAKRLSETTGNDAMTIHSFLRWDLEENKFQVNEENPAHVDFLIVDEFSMVDTWLFSNLLKAIPNVKRICVIGDEDQLPSVSPGCVLRDLIASESFNLVRLNHIYRQKEGSDVITLAHEMIHDNVDFGPLTNDVAFFQCNKYMIKDYLVQVVDNALKRGYGPRDIQVLAPMYGGAAGIDVLNKTLQETFNPKEFGKKECKYGYRIFREGDKILQLKNQPDDDVYNGDIGILRTIIDAKESEDHKMQLIIEFNSNFVQYSMDHLDNITHAYCISIHKSQGSEYPIVIMPICYDYYYMLQRKILYTGVTRASKALVLIGEKNAFFQGVETNERHVRNTTLKEKVLHYKRMFSSMKADE